MIRKNDVIELSSCNSFGWSATYGYRYKGLRGMRWQRRPDGGWAREPLSYWPFVCLDRYQAFRGGP